MIRLYLLLGGILILIIGCVMSIPALRSELALSKVNPIVLENQKLGNKLEIAPSIITNIKENEEERFESLSKSDLAAAAGSSGWTRQPIEGYAGADSVNKGQSIQFYISTANPNYTMKIYRIGYYGGAGSRLISTISNLTGQQQPVPAQDPTTGLVAANWNPTYTLQTGTDWVSGLYIARLDDSANNTGYILFVVRDDAATADIVYQVPTTTYQAYNNWGGKSLYDYNSDNSHAAYKVSYDRPYAQASGLGFMYDGDYSTIRFLESHGYNVTYVTSHDTQSRPGMFSQRKAFMVSYHDEYWSKQMRDNLTNAQNNGLNIAFFSGNNIYWQIRYENSASGVADRIITCYKDATLDPMASTNPSLTTVTWRDQPVNLPENALLGNMYEAQLNNRYSWIVNNSSHWVYQGTNVKNGDAIPTLVEREYDKVYNNNFTPANLTVLSTSPLVNANGDSSAANGVIYTTANGAITFDAGTLYWAKKLENNDVWTNEADPRVQQMTQNILNKMINNLASPTPSASASSSPTPTPTPTTTPSATPSPTPTSSPSPSPTPGGGLTAGLIGNWKFDEAAAWNNNCLALSVLDSSVNLLNGASCLNKKGPTSGVTGRLGLARNFSGVNAFVQIANNSLLNFNANQDFSYSLWIKRTNSSASSFVLTKGAAGTGDTGYSFILYDGHTPTIDLSKSGESSRLEIFGPNINDTNWHLITATFSRTGNTVLYIDGVVKAQANISGYNVNLTNSKPLTIGCRADGAICYTGLIDEVRMYNRVLSATEVGQLYNQ